MRKSSSRDRHTGTRTRTCEFPDDSSDMLGCSVTSMWTSGADAQYHTRLQEPKDPSAELNPSTDTSACFSEVLSHSRLRHCVALHEPATNYITQIKPGACRTEQSLPAEGPEPGQVIGVVDIVANSDYLMEALNLNTHNLKNSDVRELFLGSSERETNRSQLQ